MFIISLAFISITKGIVIIALSSLRTCQQTHAEFRPPPPTPLMAWVGWNPPAFLSEASSISFFQYPNTCKSTASFIIWPSHHLVWPIVLCCPISSLGDQLLLLLRRLANHDKSDPEFNPPVSFLPDVLFKHNDIIGCGNDNDTQVIFHPFYLSFWCVYNT